MHVLSIEKKYNLAFGYLDTVVLEDINGMSKEIMLIFKSTLAILGARMKKLM